MTPSRDGAVTGLHVEGVTVRFGGLVAVDDVSLSAPAGRLTGLIGPNGAGKTTTFNACSGLVPLAGGRVSLDGDDVTDLGAAQRARRGLGRTFQKMELYDTMTVAENVALGREVRFAGARLARQIFGSRAEARAVAEATEEALARCGLTALGERRVGALSAGQRRLVELARLYAGDFPLALLDEPSSGLDSRETEEFGRIVRSMVDERGCGVLLVEHDMSLVMSICDYLYVLDFGRLIFEGTPAETRASAVVRAAYLGEEDEALAVSAGKVM